MQDLSLLDVHHESFGEMVDVDLLGGREDGVNREGKGDGRETGEGEGEEEGELHDPDWRLDIEYWGLGLDEREVERQGNTWDFGGWEFCCGF